MSKFLDGTDKAYLQRGAGIATKHPCLEFINACACCDVYGELVRSLAPRYEGRVEVKVYTAGKDFDYLPKYGNISKSMLIINESKAVTRLSKTAVQGAFEEAIRSI